MGVELGLIVVGVILVLAAGAPAWRRIRVLRGRAALDGNLHSLGRDTALVMGAFCAIVLMVTMRALGLH